MTVQNIFYQYSTVSNISAIIAHKVNKTIGQQYIEPSNRS
jgi:hypothetical protein